MFGLFGKKKESLLVHDKIWSTEKAKFNALLAAKKSDPALFFVAWFEETKINLEAYFKKNNIEEEIYLANNLSLMQHGKKFIFVEHHPLQKEEQRVATRFDLKEITVYSSLTEPIFELFGADRIVELLKQMGFNENEMIEHTMVSKSIVRAQEKIASKTATNATAKSQKEWFSNAGLSKI